MPLSFMLLDVCVIAIAGLSAVWVITRLARRGADLSIDHVHRSVRYLLPATVLMLAGVVGLTVCNTRNEILWGLPLWFDEYSTRAIWSLLLFFLCHTAGLLITCVCLERSPHRFRATIVSCGLILAFLSVQWAYTRTISHRLTPRIENSIIVQTSAFSCTAASAANMLRYFGIDQTEVQMAERMETTVHGSTTASFVRELGRSGVSSRKVFVEDRQISTVHPPAMLIVDVDDQVEAHAVVYARMFDGMYVIWDPGPGLRRLMTDEEVRAIWHGRAVECWRSVND